LCHSKAALKTLCAPFLYTEAAAAGAAGLAFVSPLLLKALLLKVLLFKVLMLHKLRQQIPFAAAANAELVAGFHCHLSLQL
jgi:hypothetical protein